MYVLSLSNSSLNSLGHNSFRMLKKIKITNLECSHMHWKSRSAGNLTFTDFTRCLILCVFFTLTPTSSQFLPSNRKSLKNSVDASTPELKQTKHFIYFSSFTDKISKFIWANGAETARLFLCPADRILDYSLSLSTCHVHNSFWAVGHHS